MFLMLYHDKGSRRLSRALLVFIFIFLFSFSTTTRRVARVSASCSLPDHHHTLPPSKRESEGVSTPHHSPPLPCPPPRSSLARNARQRGIFTRHHNPAPPSLEMRDGGFMLFSHTHKGQDASQTCLRYFFVIYLFTLVPKGPETRR